MMSTTLTPREALEIAIEARLKCGEEWRPTLRAIIDHEDGPGLDEAIVRADIAETRYHAAAAEEDRLRAAIQARSVVRSNTRDAAEDYF